MSEPTDYAMDHGARVNMVQNASLLFSKERGDWRGAMPMTFEQADAFLSCLRSAGFEIQTKRGKYPKDVLVVHGDYPQAKSLQELTELAESLGHQIVMVERVSAHDRMAEVVRAGVAALAAPTAPSTGDDFRPEALAILESHLSTDEKFEKLYKLADSIPPQTGPLVEDEKGPCAALAAPTAPSTGVDVERVRGRMYRILEDFIGAEPELGQVNEKLAVAIESATDSILAALQATPAQPDTEEEGDIK